jgi:hypothetical protein
MSGEKAVEEGRTASVGSSKGSALRRIEDVALELCRKEGRTTVWYGDPQLCQDIYAATGRSTARHPLNQIAAVMSALAKSSKWKLSGYITHLGRKYPLRKPNAAAQPTRRTDA